ncbi:ATP-binding protein [Streptomyces sp. NBC_01304]|uniref:ATP-binding protein n=1 Tax=Streptomyces sp. NBC_01304 TaxID=2903818 RepID=UPI002E0F9700|nr:ATP-binding protein [Streptomyces sp. NBC_01304]
MVTVSPPEPWSYALHLPHDPRAPRVARMTLRAALSGHGIPELLDTAELLTSEMVTNAYRHTEGAAAMRVRGFEGGRIRVGVWDSNPHIPPPFDRPPRMLGPAPDLAPDGEGGRGLLLVQLWADDWGGYPLGDDLFGRGGKLLWFELEAAPGLARAA